MFDYEKHYLENLQGTFFGGVLKQIQKKIPKS